MPDRTMDGETRSGGVTGIGGLRRSVRVVTPWILLLFVALALRVWGLSDGAGYIARDEMNYVPKAVRFGGGDLNPHYFQNPPLWSYLVFGSLGVRFAWGRITGEYGTSLDFKAGFLAGSDDAFVAARCLVLVLALVSIVQVAAFARDLARDLPERTRVRAGWLAALVLTGSALHAERSMMATNDILSLLLYSVASLSAFALARSGTFRSAIVAGLLVGIAGGAKYTGALTCFPVGIAALLAEGQPLTRRVRLLFTAGGAAITGFLLACPWAALDHATFRAHLADFVVLKDRFSDGQGWRRYLETLWGPGLGPVWTLAAGAGLVALAIRALRGRGAARVSAIVALACVVPIMVSLSLHTELAYGRYLFPVYSALVAITAAWVARVAGERVWAVGAAWVFAAVPIVVAASGVPARAAEARRELTQDSVAEWMRANVPDGAHVVLDWQGPRLPPTDGRREFEGRVSQAAWARLVPAFRTTTAFDYFALPVNRLKGTQVPVDDLAGLAAHAPIWFVQSEEVEAIFPKLPPGDYPAMRWYDVTRSLPVVHEVLPGEGLRGPAFRIRVLR